MRAGKAPGAAFGHRSEIDGLRAVAVLPVILCHAGLAAFSGGYVGVDVFFVISGYLITGLLLADLDRGRFSLVAFYDRRARRLLPALLVVLAAALPPAFLWLPPPDFRAFGDSLAAAALFVPNLLFWRQGGYFDQEAALKPLLHLWSLGVEEQFYLVFPPLLWLVWRRARRLLGPLLALAALASLLLCLWGARAAPSAAFYLAPARAWELLAGALCALHHHRRPPAGPPGAGGGAAALAGLALILAAVPAFDAQTPFPSGRALLPAGGAALVLLFARPGTLAARLLSRPPLVGLGLVSYSAYLWHQPLFAFARLRSPDPPGPGAMLALAGLTMVLAWATWRWVEQPFRRRRAGAEGGPARLPRGPFAAAGTGLAAVLAAGLLLPALQGRLVPPLALPAGWRDGGPCTFEDRAAPARLAACLAGIAPGRAAFLIGDSHAAAVSLELRRALEGRGYTLVSLTRSACYPLPGTLRRTDPQAGACSAFVDAAWQAAAGRPGAPVILMARWALNIEGSRFDNGQGGVEDGPPGAASAAADTGDAGGGLPGPEGRRAALLARSEAAIAALARHNPVVVLGPFPEAGWDVPRQAWKRARFGGGTAAGAGGADLAIPAAAVRKRLGGLDPFLAALAALPGVRVVRLEPLFCGSGAAGLCRQAGPGYLHYRDDDHPAPDAARRIAGAAVDALPGAVAGR